jgi:hypothetical protein
MHARNDEAGGSSSQIQNPSRRRPPAAAIKKAPLNLEPAVIIFNGCDSQRSKNESPVVHLQNYCEQFNLEQPKYKTILIGREDGKQVYNCKVQVNVEINGSVFAF